MNITEILATFDSAHSLVRTEPAESTRLLLYALDALREDIVRAVGLQHPTETPTLDLDPLLEAITQLQHIPTVSQTPGLELLPALTGITDSNTALLELLKLLEHRLRGVGSGGGGGPSVVGLSTETVERLTGLVPVAYNAISLAYTGDNITTVTYKVGATTVATLTLGYTGDNLTSVVRT